MSAELYFESISRQDPLGQEPYLGLCLPEGVKQLKPTLVFHIATFTAVLVACGGGSSPLGRSPEQKPDSQPVIRVEPWLTPLPNGAQAIGAVVFGATGDAVFTGQVVVDLSIVDGSAGYGADVTLPGKLGAGAMAQGFVGIQDWRPRLELHFWPPL